MSLSGRRLRIPSTTGIVTIRLKPAEQEALDRLVKIYAQKYGEPVSRQDAIRTAVFEVLKTL